MRRDLAVEPPGREVVEQGVEFLGGDPVPVAVVHLEARGLRARGLALRVLQREQPVGRRRAGLDPELVLGVVHQLLGPHQRTRQRAADVDEVLAGGLEPEHLVERGRAEHLGRSDRHRVGGQQFGDVTHRVLGDVAVLLLREVHERDQRRLRLRVAGDDLAGERDIRIGESHRSTSPRTGSTEEITATASATRPPRIMCGRHWMLANEGPRMCMRYGVAVPSEAM